MKKFMVCKQQRNGTLQQLPNHTVRMSVLTTLLIVTISVIAFTLGAFVFPKPVPANLTAAPDSTTVAVQTISFDDTQLATAQFQIGDAYPLIVHIQGQITASQCQKGNRVNSGQIIAYIDNMPIIALHTAIPLYRDVSLGIAGDDITSLQHELVRLGKLSDRYVEGVYDDATHRAVLDLFTNENNAQYSAEELPCENIVWIPDTHIVLSSWQAQTGTYVTPESQIGTSRARLDSITVSNINNLDLAQYQATIYDVTTQQIHEDGHIDDTNFLEQVSQTTQYSELLNSLTQGAVAQAQVTLQRTEAVEALQVPPTVLFGVGSGTGCIMDSQNNIHRVQIISSTLGSSILTLQDNEKKPPNITFVRIGSILRSAECK